MDKFFAGFEIDEGMAAAVGGFVDAHSGGALLGANGTRMDSYVGESVVAEIGFEELAILGLGFDGYDFTGWASKFPKEAGKVTDVGANVQEIAARSI
jgi:hypothetical protein